MCKKDLETRIKTLDENGCNVYQIAMLTGVAPTSITRILVGTKIFLDKKVKVIAKKQYLISNGIDGDCKGLVGIVSKVFNDTIYVKFAKDYTLAFSSDMLTIL